MLILLQADGSEPPSYSHHEGLDRLRNLRDFLRSEGHSQQQLRAFDALDREMDEMSNRSLDTTGERRRRTLDVDASGQDPVPAPNPATRRSPSEMIRSRRRAFRPSARIRESSQNPFLEHSDQIDSIMNLPPPLSPSLNVDNRSYMSETEASLNDRSRAKRRKLGDGTYESTPTFSYGQKGQVEAGSLRLELVHCDGGDHDDAHLGHTYPVNVLRDDTSVYCTKNYKCNMLFKHTGGMPFSLTKIVIKAPKHGYDAAVQEGMIFVAMDGENLVDKTSQYEIKYSPRSLRYHYRRYDHYRPSQDHFDSTRPPLRSIDRSRYLSDPHPPWSRDEDSVFGTPLVPDFHVMVADPSDEEDNVANPPSPRPWHDHDAEYSLRSYTGRYRPYGTSNPPDNASETSDDSDGEVNPAPPLLTETEAMEEALFRQRRMMHEANAMRLRVARERADIRAARTLPDPEEHRRLTPSRIELQASNGASTRASMSSKMVPATTLSTTITPSESTVLPHARFFIRHEKSSVAIKFDPPV